MKTRESLTVKIVIPTKENTFVFVVEYVLTYTPLSPLTPGFFLLDWQYLFERSSGLSLA